VARIPLPYSSTASGISATDGIGRRNSIVEAVAARSTGTEPISAPSASPAATASARPTSQVRSVWASATQNSGRPACPPSATAIRLVGGA
jgi:hypothetical protein